jgi:hypothetical protein
MPESIQLRMQWGNGSCFPGAKQVGMKKPIYLLLLPLALHPGLDLPFLTFSVEVKMRTAIPTPSHALMCIKLNNLAIIYPCLIRASSQSHFYFPAGALNLITFLT